MSRFLATITPVGGNLYMVDQVSRPTDPGYGQGHPPIDPDYGFGVLPHPGHGLPGFGHPDNSLPGYGHAGHPLPVPPPAGVVTPPIVLPERPHLPVGTGIVVPLPADATVPAPTGEAPPKGTKPHILWYGPGTQPTVVYLPPSTPSATPK